MDKQKEDAKYQCLWIWAKDHRVSMTSRIFDVMARTRKRQFQTGIPQERLAGSKWDLHHSTQRPKLYDHEVLIFGEVPL